MKRNTEAYVTITPHDERDDVLVFGGRLDNEIESENGDLMISIYTGYGVSRFRLKAYRNSSAERWGWECVNMAANNSMDAAGIPTDKFIDQEGQFKGYLHVDTEKGGFSVMAQEGAPVLVEIYDMTDKGAQYIHDLNPDDLTDEYRDIYNRLINMTDVQGDPLASHLATEEDFLPTLWLAYEYGEYGGRKAGTWSHDPQTGKAVITGNTFENGDPNILVSGNVHTKFSGSGNRFPEDPGAPGSSNDRSPNPWDDDRKKGAGFPDDEQL